jgi:hypothetical protein
MKLVSAQSRVAVAVARGQFGNPGRGTSAVGSRYQKAGKRQQTKNTQCVYSALTSMRNRVTM